MSTYAIGDIQGCFDCFRALLSLIQFDPKEDKLYLVGDLVNRGPASYEVLSYCYNHQSAVQVVLGNHDISLLMVWQGLLTPSKSDTFDQILNKKSAEPMLDWLAQQPLMRIDAPTKTVMTHAGLYPYWTIEQAYNHSQTLSHALSEMGLKAYLTSIYGKTANLWSKTLAASQQLQFICNAFTLMRYVSMDGQLQFKQKGSSEVLPDGTSAWFKHPNLSLGEYKVVFGHWAALEGRCSHPAVHAIDTGCIWGGELTALRLEDNQRFAVNCPLETEKG